MKELHRRAVVTALLMAMAACYFYLAWTSPLPAIDPRNGNAITITADKFIIMGLVVAVVAAGEGFSTITYARANND